MIDDKIDYIWLMTLPADTSLAPMTPDTTRNMNRRYQLFSQYILSFVCSRDSLVCRAVVYCRILQGPRYVLCSARRRGLDYRRTRARTPCDDGDWSQESSEQVLRNTTLTARRELCYRAYTGRLHNSQNVGSQTGAARSFAARQTEQLWNFQNLPKLLHKSPDWHAGRLQWREGREKSLR